MALVSTLHPKPGILVNELKYSFGILFPFRLDLGERLMKILIENDGIYPHFKFQGGS